MWLALNGANQNSNESYAPQRPEVMHPDVFRDVWCGLEAHDRFLSIPANQRNNCGKRARTRKKGSLV